MRKEKTLKLKIKVNKVKKKQNKKTYKYYL